MKSLVFDSDANDQEIDNEAEEAKAEIVADYEDLFFNILEQNFQPDSNVKQRLSDWAQDSLFLAMPYTAKANFSGPSGTLRRCLTVIDYMNALNVGWGIEVKKEDLVTIAVLKHLALSGVFDEPKMYQKAGKGINIRKITWGVNQKHDNVGAYISKLYMELFRSNIFVSNEVINALSDIVCKQSGHKLSFLLTTAETYVDKFIGS